MVLKFVLGPDFHLEDNVNFEGLVLIGEGILGILCNKASINVRAGDSCKLIYLFLI